jgi:hypothetical protein
MRKNSLRRRQKKILIKWNSKYMNYPENSINKLGKIIQAVDFVWPRFIAWDSKPYYFLSSRYIRPNKEWMLELIEWETSKETIKILMDMWKNNPIPDVMKIDNDMAFWNLKSNKTERCIWTFTKFLLYLWIIPLYSAVRSPWNNWSVEWQNSMFSKMFWNDIMFEWEEHLRIELTRFNTEYKWYSRLKEISEDEIKKAWIKYRYLDNLINQKNPISPTNSINPKNSTNPNIDIDISKLQNFEYLKWLKMEDLQAKEMYILRKVERSWKKESEEEKWVIEILWESIELDKQYINLILLNKIDLKTDKLEIMNEVNWDLQTIKKVWLKVRNL